MVVFILPQSVPLLNHEWFKKELYVVVQRYMIKCSSNHPWKLSLKLCSFHVAH